MTMAGRALAISVGLAVLLGPSAASAEQTLGGSALIDRLSAHPIEIREFIARPDDGASTPGVRITVGRALDIVGRPIDLAAARPPEATGIGQPGTAPLGMPLSGARFSSAFGMRTHPLFGRLMPHRGVDLAAPTGTPIRATGDATVARANWQGGYGLSVVLDHGAGLQSRYGHMSRLSVAAGTRVKRGDVIGYVGSTGRSTGAHLHYEVRRNGQAIDPSSSLRAR